MQKSLAQHRVYSMWESWYHGTEEYQYYKDIAHEVYKIIEKKFIPKNREMEFDRFMFERDLATESAALVFAQEVWKQGFLDGLEMSKVLN
ncbi:MAG: hypothetical protein FIA99_05515 [Ruminiclostridium sp.]|nr:hypothetical protein [Ruminiclostridium sp.]